MTSCLCRLVPSHQYGGQWGLVRVIMAKRATDELHAVVLAHSATRCTSTKLLSSSTTTMAPSTVDNKVWLITGCSSGFGQQLAIAARKRGDHVIATARKVETLDELKSLGCDVLALDVTAADAVVNDVVAQAHAIYGRFDILVNNAGFAPVGAVEEASTEEIQALFDTNVFGLVRVARAVLPYLREKKSGVVANIGSMAGIATFPACGIYSASKAAVGLMTQALRMEAAPLGIEVTSVELGPFRTSALSKGHIHAKSIADYDELTSGFKQAVSLGGGMVPAANPVLGAQALVEALTKTGRCVDRPLPSRLPLGVCYDAIHAAFTLGLTELDAWKDFTGPEAFPLDA